LSGKGSQDFLEAEEKLEVGELIRTIAAGYIQFHFRGRLIVMVAVKGFGKGLPDPCGFPVG
jgi:hypothetical protein